MRPGAGRAGWAAAALALCLATSGCAPADERGRVLILVVDGLRPDYVTPDLMPRLDALARGGVRGLVHHAVFPTVTRVNGPSIFTGRHPSGHGMLGNSVYLPDVDPSRVLDAGQAADLRLIDEATGGALLTAPSLGEILADRGLTLFAASSGSTGSGTLMNHRGAGAGLVHHELTIPDTLEPVVEAALGPPPRIAPGSPSTPLVARAVDAVLRIGIDRADADVLAAWLTEPDGTAHATGIGSPRTLAVLAAVDAEIGRLLDGLAERGELARTNILVTSDHGFTERTGSRSLTQLLVEAGLKESAGSLDVVVAGDAIHVAEGGEERIAAIVELLQRTEWIGPVFSRAPADGGDLGRYEGTVSFSAIGWEHERSADLLTSASWTDEENEWGYRGAVLAAGSAGHGSSSPFDIRATFIAAGPDVKEGVVSDVPTGNVDLLPTALELAGAAPPPGLDGRVLSEVLRSGPDPQDVEVTEAPVTASIARDGLRYELTVSRSRVGAALYLDGTSVTRSGGGR